MPWPIEGAIIYTFRGKTHRANFLSLQDLLKLETGEIGSTFALTANTGGFDNPDRKITGVEISEKSIRSLKAIFNLT